MDHAASTDIRIATPDEDVRLNTFIQGFLSDNGFPFIMVRSDPDLDTGAALKRVMFETDELTRRFYDAWSSYALGDRRRLARGRA
ncbi:MAG: hypothetical protein BGN86_02725 [Caulobacterales bacterium 68-7]|nr:hypothetical protein [Caulobacterales bacterium]OJU10289.1 MAG: hypothetical protein BGN86_02725 [Caulobacterales bacterium 68-7]